jgi:sugar phosphate isomerase/epimerase
MKTTIDRFSRYWPDLPLITNTGALPDSGNELEVWQGCIRYYQELADYAANKGMRLALAALGPSLMNRSTIFSTLGEAHELVEEINRDNVGLCVDLYNSWQGAALLEAIMEAADKLLVVHLADWKRPRSYHDRYALGDGEIPLTELLVAINETGYAGPYVLELFSEQVPDSLWQDSTALEQALIRSQQRFERTWMTSNR